MPSQRLMDRGAATKEVEEAQRLIETDDQGVVIPRLLHVIAKYPHTDAAADAHYWLGVSYYKMQNYHDAMDMFRQYLLISPYGRYAGESAKMVDRLTEESDKRFMPQDKLNKAIADAQAQLAADPGNPQLRLSLADLLWKRGDYAKAGEVYAALVAANPQYGANQVVAERIEFRTDGRYVVLSPDEVQRRAVLAQPLVVVSANAFRSGRDLLTRERMYYVVAGQVQNRSDAVLYGAQVAVTLYGFGGVVYDTGTFNLGRMNPKEVRAFSVQFSNFPTLDDIERFDVVPTFQR